MNSNSPYLTLTILGALGLLAILQFARGKPAWKQFVYDSIGVGSLALALGTSYDILRNPPTGLTGLWALLVPWPAFFLAVLVKLLIIFYGMIVITGLLQPNRIRKFGAKVFGVEINGEYYDTLVSGAQKWEELTSREFELISLLNEKIFLFATGWPHDMIEAIRNSPDVAEALVNHFTLLLEEAYLHFSDVSLRVFQATEAFLRNATKEYKNIAKNLEMQYKEETPVAKVIGEVYGLSIYHGTSDLPGCIVIIDCSGSERVVTSYELQAVSTLYILMRDAVVSG